jgi:hypothetical protein
MGSVTKQWLKGDPSRRQFHYLIDADVVTEVDHRRIREKEVGVEMTIRRGDGDYQNAAFNTG